MDQNPTEENLVSVKFSLRTKLLLSTLTLLILIIAFLNFSTVFIIRQDKTAYTFDLEATQSLLAGNEFSTATTHALGVLHAALAASDPLMPLQPQDLPTLQKLLDNQSELVAISVGALNLNDEALRSKFQVKKDELLNQLQIKIDDLNFSPEVLKPIIPELLNNSYALVNMAHDGTPLLGILTADTKLKDNPIGMPLSWGVISLKKLSQDLVGKNIIIATPTGSILFATDPALYYGHTRLDSPGISGIPNVQDPLFQLASHNVLKLGASEFTQGGTQYLGSYTRTDTGAIVLDRVDYQSAMRSTYMLIGKFLLLGGIAIAIGIIFAILFSKSLTAPLMRLFRGTEEVSRGNFDLQMEADSQDEIGALTLSFNGMSKKIQELIKSSMEGVRIENELAIASTVQQTLFPGPVFKNNYVDIFSHYKSASECGGDWWGFFTHSDKLCLMIADATGHGLPSALITASARSCFSVLAKLSQEDPDFSFSPAHMLSYANQTIWDASNGKIMMTFFVGVFDFKKKTLTFASAGHNPPWLFKHENGQYALKSLVSLGPRLGENENLTNVEEKTVAIGLEDILFLYTDGLIEGTDLSGVQYGKKRARQVVEASLSGGAEALIAQLSEDYQNYNQGKPLDDDVTLAAVKINSLTGVSQERKI